MRHHLYAVLLIMLVSPSALAGGLGTPRGSKDGVFGPDPYWSAGIQLGNYGGTGPVAQTLAWNNAATNLGLGFVDRSIAAHADHLFLFDSEFRRIQVAKTPGYNALRGRFALYGGGGIQVGDGVSLRAPVGVQYGMYRDPFNFYAGMVLMAGRFFADTDFGIDLWINLGARVLL